jgi:hypothetical protein
MIHCSSPYPRERWRGESKISIFSQIDKKCLPSIVNCGILSSEYTKDSA